MWLTLDSFDRNDLPRAGRLNEAVLDGNALEIAILAFRAQLMQKGEASALFATEKYHGALQGILGNVLQEVFGEKTYPTLEAKARAYFIFHHQKPSI